MLGIRNLTTFVISISSPDPVPCLNVITSGCFFLAVILRMEFSLFLCFILAHPARSESSLNTIMESAVNTI